MALVEGLVGGNASSRDIAAYVASARCLDDLWLQLSISDDL